MVVWVRQTEAHKIRAPVHAQHMAPPAEQPSVADSNAREQTVAVEKAAIENRNSRLFFGHKLIVHQNNIALFHLAVAGMLAKAMADRHGDTAGWGADSVLSFQWSVVSLQ